MILEGDDYYTEEYYSICDRILDITNNHKDRFPNRTIKTLFLGQTEVSGLHLDNAVIPTFFHIPVQVSQKETYIGIESE